jgi:hypothetical protein
MYPTRAPLAARLISAMKDKVVIGVLDVVNIEFITVVGG